MRPTSKEARSLDACVSTVVQACPHVPPEITVASLKSLCEEFDTIVTVSRLRRLVETAVRDVLRRTLQEATGDCEQKHRENAADQLRQEVLQRCSSDSEWRSLLTATAETLAATHTDSSVNPTHRSCGDVLCLEADFVNLDILDLDASFPADGRSDGGGDEEDLLQQLEAQMRAYCVVNPQTLSIMSPSVASQGADEGLVPYQQPKALRCIQALLELSSDTVLHLDWTVLVAILVESCTTDPATAVDVTVQYFRGSSARQRFTLTAKLVEALGAAKGAPEPLLLQTVLSFMQCLPEDWTCVVDSETEDLLYLFLFNVTFPYAVLCEREDPGAKWLSSWLRRPTVSHCLSKLSTAHPSCVQQMAARFPNRYAMQMVCYLLPCMVPSEGDPLPQPTSQLAHSFLRALVNNVWSDMDGVIFAARSGVRCLGEEDRIQLLVAITDRLEVAAAEAAAWYIQLLECVLLPATCLSLTHSETLRLRLAAIANHVEKFEASEDFAGKFWLALLPSYWELVPDVVDRCTKLLACGTEGPYTWRHLVLLSGDLRAWLHLRRALSAENIDYGAFGASLLGSLLGDPHTVAMEGYPADLSPSAIAVLMRWSSIPKLRDSLGRAAKELLDKHVEAIGAFVPLPQGRDWPLAIPPESYAHSMAALIPHEYTPAQQQSYVSAARYQAVHLLLHLLTLPPGPIDTAAHFLSSVLDQLHHGWLQGDTAAPPAGYDEESLVALLNLCTITVLTSPTAEAALWRSARHRETLRLLRGLCVGRVGSDAAFFMVRFLTTGRGRRRLVSILLHGPKAELHMDTGSTVRSLEAEAYPSLAEEESHTLSAESVEQLLVNSFPTWGTAREAVREAIRNFIFVYSARHPSLGAQSYAALLSQRGLLEWASFLDLEERTQAVALQLAVCDADGVCSLLRAAGIDSLFLASLCVYKWVWCAWSLADGDSVLRISVKEFVQHGLCGWDAQVARSLAAHVRIAAEDDACRSAGEWCLPLCCAVPLPSPLFAVIIVTPFRLLAGNRGDTCALTHR